MSDLERFLNLPDINDEIEEVFVSERLGKFKVKPMTVKQHQGYQKRCTTIGKKGNVTFDSSRFNLLLIQEQVISPRFDDADFLAKAGYMTAADFINAKFKAGEVAELASKIVEISGFETDINDEIEEAKN